MMRSEDERKETTMVLFYLFIYIITRDDQLAVVLVYKEQSVQSEANNGSTISLKSSSNGLEPPSPVWLNNVSLPMMNKECL